MKPKLVWLLLLSSLLLGGCASSSMTIAPGAEPTKLKSFYVQKLPADSRGVERLIATRLVARGFQATYGEEATPPTEVDAIVTYQDRWAWDITMYMLQLNLQVRDAKSRMIIASGTSTRPSLQRKSQQGMVDEVLTSIFPTVKPSS